MGRAVGGGQSCGTSIMERWERVPTAEAPQGVSWEVGGSRAWGWPGGDKGRLGEAGSHPSTRPHSTEVSELTGDPEGLCGERWWP